MKMELLRADQVAVGMAIESRSGWLRVAKTDIQLDALGERICLTDALGNVVQAQVGDLIPVGIPDGM